MSTLKLNESALKTLIKHEIIKTSFANLSELRGIMKANQFCNKLVNTGISYELCIKHKEVKSCEQSAIYYKRFERYLNENYGICKHLFVKEKKGEKRYLLVTDYQKNVDFKELREILVSRKLEFVTPEEMNESLKTTPGNVSIFNIMNDTEHQIDLIIDKCLLSYPLLAFHPLYNGMSLFIKPKEMVKFLEMIEHGSVVIDIPEKVLEDESAKTYVKK